MGLNILRLGSSGQTNSREQLEANVDVSDPSNYRVSGRTRLHKINGNWVKIPLKIIFLPLNIIITSQQIAEECGNLVGLPNSDACLEIALNITKNVVTESYDIAKTNIVSGVKGAVEMTAFYAKVLGINAAVREITGNKKQPIFPIAFFKIAYDGTDYSLDDPDIKRKEFLAAKAKKKAEKAARREQKRKRKRNKKSED